MKRWIVSGTILFLSLLIGNSLVYAEDRENSYMGGYTIEGVPNVHQIDKNASYFFLGEEPGVRDQIKIKLINNSTDKKTLKVKVTNANTNINGIIDYTGTIADHKELKIPLTTIVKPQENEIKVGPKSEVEAILDIQMPKEKQEGIILGGVVVSEKQDETKQENNVSVENIYSYTLGILLTNNKEVKMNQNKSVELEKVEAVLSDGKKIVQANILNPNPYIFGEASVSGKILNEEETQTIQESKKESVKIAPYSIFPFQFDWKKEELKPGNYVFEGKVKTEDNEWSFKRKFKITETEAKKINKESVFKIQIPDWLEYSAFVSIIVTFLGTIWLIIVRGRKKNE